MLGAAVTWNISNVGAIAERDGRELRRLARGGRAADDRRSSSPTSPCRFPAAGWSTGSARAASGSPRSPSWRRRTRSRSSSPSLGLGLGARVLMGLGTGAGFVAGHRSRPLGQGRPVLAGRLRRRHDGGRRAGADGRPAARRQLGWRAPYWTGLVLALAGALPVLAARARRRAPAPRCPRGVAGGACSATGASGRSAAVQMATFGLSVVAGNWVVTLLEREGHGRSISGVVGGLVLFAGVVTRPAGGLVVRRDRGRAWTLVAVSLVVGSAGMLVLAAAPPLWRRRARRAGRRPRRRLPVRGRLRHDAAPPARRSRQRRSASSTARRCS